MFYRRPILTALLLGATLAPLPARAQNLAPPSPPATPELPADTAPVTTLKVNTHLVEVSAVVLSKSGEPQGGLTKDDFILREDGKDEPIRYFSQGSDLPLTLALVVDTSGSQRTFISDESLASDVFFESMLTRPEDRASLVQVDTRVLELQPLTNSADRLHLALNRLGSDARTANGTRLFDAIQAISNQVLGPSRGRKAVILLSDGGDNGSRASIEDAIAAAERSNVQIYSIEYSAWNRFQAPPSSGSGGTLLSNSVTLPPSGPRADPGLHILQHLSESTGGRVFAVSPGSSLRAIYARIADDLRLQYELGYTPPPDLPPNSYHKLEVRLRDKHLAVQARKGFFAQP